MRYDDMTTKQKMIFDACVLADDDMYAATSDPHCADPVKDPLRRILSVLACVYSEKSGVEYRGLPLAPTVRKFYGHGVTASMLRDAITYAAKYCTPPPDVKGIVSRRRAAVYTLAHECRSFVRVKKAVKK